jgi:hypothetical protein
VAIRLTGCGLSGGRDADGNTELRLGTGGFDGAGRLHAPVGTGPQATVPERLEAFALAASRARRPLSFPGLPTVSRRAR